MTQVREKLEITPEGDLVSTGKKEIPVTGFDGLHEINFNPSRGLIVVQPLPEKEVVTTSGLVLPASKQELKAVVVVARGDSEYKRGQLVKIDDKPFIRVNQQGQMKLEIPVDYIDGKACLQIPEHFILGDYPGIDLSTWKAE